MTWTYYAQINYYSFLVGRPLAWELIFDESLDIKKGDTINVIEVDSTITPTGNTMMGEVIYKRCNDFFEYSEKNTLVYVLPL